MKTTKLLLTLGMVSLVMGISGCMTLHKSDQAALQGSWSGHEVGRESQGVCHLTISGNQVEFRGADSREWYKATFVLYPDKTPKQLVATVRDCFYPKYIGKTATGIYRLDDDSLTLSANEPGDPDLPSTFQAPDSRTFVLKKE